MPKTISLIRAFLASPSDVSEERIIVKKVVDELNNLHGSWNNVRIELIGWETHTFPNIGLHPQEVINRQIGIDYDIFIGIMWKKFGSKTLHADSGTEEEFNIAHQKYIDSPNNIDILFFFKDTPTKISEINIEQLVKINEFKLKIQSENYYKSFVTIDEFENLLRYAFTQIIIKYSIPITDIKSVTKLDTHILPTEITLQKSMNEKEEIEEVGYFESIEITNKLFSTMTNSIAAVEVAIVSIGKKFAVITQKILISNSKPNARQEAQKSIDLLANDLANFSSSIKRKIPILRDNFNEAMILYNNMILFQNYYDKENNIYVQELNNIRSSSLIAYESIESFTITLKELPSFTTKYRKFQKESIKVLDELLDVIKGYSNTIDQLLLNDN